MRWRGGSWLGGGGRRDGGGTSRGAAHGEHLMLLDPNGSAGNESAVIGLGLGLGEEDGERGRRAEADAGRGLRCVPMRVETQGRLRCGGGGIGEEDALSAGGDLVRLGAGEDDRLLG